MNSQTSKDSQSKRTAILLLGGNKQLARSALTYAKQLFDVIHYEYNERSAKSLSAKLIEMSSSKPDFLFNFLSPMIIPKRLLDEIQVAPINFHPGPPEHPGVGAPSFALYKQETSFGVTAHIMAAKVDAGPILRTLRFPIISNETCDCLFDRALNYTLTLFYELLYDLHSNHGVLEPSGENWAKHAVTRKEFEQWITLSLQDDPEEVVKKANAIRHARFPGPYLEFGGCRFAVLPTGGVIL